MFQNRLRRIGEMLDVPVALLALLVVPALLLEDRAASPDLQRAALAFNWVVWIAFCVEFVILWAAEPRWSTIRKTWFDLLLIVLSPPFLVPEYFQATRSLRVIRIFRLVRLIRAGAVAAIGLRLTRGLFAHRKFHFVGLVAVAIVLLGALGLYLLEGGTNPAVSSFGDALWWSIVTATTVGYGDLSPTTTEGRVIAVVLMLTGIGVISVFTATVASFFLEPDRNPTPPQVITRLDAIEQKLDRLLSRDDKLQ